MCLFILCSPTEMLEFPCLFLINICIFLSQHWPASHSYNNLICPRGSLKLNLILCIITSWNHSCATPQEHQGLCAWFKGHFTNSLWIQTCVLIVTSCRCHCWKKKNLVWRPNRNCKSASWLTNRVVFFTLDIFCQSAAKFILFARFRLPFVVSTLLLFSLLVLRWLQWMWDKHNRYGYCYNITHIQTDAAV